MKKILLVLVVLVIGIAVLGYVRGWYTVSSNGENSVNVTVDKDKLKVDEDKAKAKLEGLKDKIQEKAGEIKKDAKEKAPGDGPK